MRRNEEIVGLERDSYRIVGMICSEQVDDAELDREIGALRARTLEVFPTRPDLFEETFGRRFNRLRTRFRPAPGLFAKP